MPSEIIYKLIRAFKLNEREKIDEIIRKLILENEQKGRYKVSKELRSLYSLPYMGNKSNNDYAATSNYIDHVNNSKVFELREPVVNKNDIILSSKNETLFKEIVETYLNRNRLIENDILVENKVLLYGPPGTGKTLFAYVLAKELKIPVLHVYLDNLISSYLGETGKNISKVFKEAENHNCLIFLDEFETIAKIRDDSQDIGEFKRTVSVLLQNIDELNPNTVLVAATNLDHLLDKAIRRRFVYEINLNYLDDNSRKKLIKLYLNKYKRVKYNILVKLSLNTSGAIIRQNINKALKKWYLENKKSNLNDLLISRFAESYFNENSINVKDKNQVQEVVKIITILRKINDKIFTYQYLQKLLNIPKSTINDLVIKYEYKSSDSTHS